MNVKELTPHIASHLFFSILQNNENVSDIISEISEKNHEEIDKFMLIFCAVVHGYVRTMEKRHPKLRESNKEFSSMLKKFPIQIIRSELDE